MSDNNGLRFENNTAEGFRVPNGEFGDTIVTWANTTSPHMISMFDEPLPEQRKVVPRDPRKDDRDLFRAINRRRQNKGEPNALQS